MTVREGLPRVSYATALDMYLNVCVVYEMAAMIEYAAVNYFTKIMPLEGGKDEEEEDQVCYVVFSHRNLICIGLRQAVRNVMVVLQRKTFLFAYIDNKTF